MNFDHIIMNPPYTTKVEKGRKISLDLDFPIYKEACKHSDYVVCLMRRSQKYKKDGWRIRISSISNSNHRTGGLNNLGKLLIFKDGIKDGKPWYDFYQKNKWSKTTPEITDSIRFNSEDEAKNFIDSVENTKFGRWYEGHIITDMNICNMNILWVDDYAHPWTDEMLYEYFGLTEDEIKEIEQGIK